jgi:hypothetical protein
MQVPPIFQNAALDPELTRLMVQALDSATMHLPGPTSRIIQEGMANRIVEAARNGERDVNRLRAAGLSWANGGDD